MGRVRVRCYGYHTEDKQLLPVEDLPWAMQMTPIHSASTSGIGQSATGVLEGSWVVGFFRDGNNCQDPLIIGTIQSKSYFEVDNTKGFNDPNGKYPLLDYVEGDEQDLPRPSRTEYVVSHPYTSKEDNRQEEVETATPPRVTKISPDKEDSYYERKAWENRKLDEIISPQYPKNHTYQSESGHIHEVDDTHDFERISDFHTSGTYEEVVANGDKTVTVVGNEFEVTFKNKNMYVKGNVNLTIDGDMKTLVKGNYHLEVEGDKTEYIKGSRVSKIGNNELIEIDQERSINIAKNLSTRVGENEVRDVIKNSTTNVTGNKSMTINGYNNKSVFGINSDFSVGDFTQTTASKYTIVSDDTYKIGTNADIDIDAVSNIDIDGSRIDLN
jgi:hypothetical protein